jgi:flavin reductase (DIM6/NTAB) family NADH-FMN oxidoreductase RutF
MAIDPRDFRVGLGQFASGVTVVTTRDGQGQPQGLTVSSFCSVSLDPPLVLVCVDNRAPAQKAVQESGIFAVSVLAEGQEQVSRSFAGGGASKFAGLELEAGTLGAPLVPGALAHVECRLRTVHLEGDHTVLVGEVERLAVSPGRPLLYHASAYHRLPGPAETTATQAPGGATVPDRV